MKIGVEVTQNEDGELWVCWWGAVTLYSNTITLNTTVTILSKLKQVLKSDCTESCLCALPLPQSTPKSLFCLTKSYSLFNEIQPRYHFLKEAPPPSHFIP